MSSLAYCLGKMKVPAVDSTAIMDSANRYEEKGFTPKEADAQAVMDYLDELVGERDLIVSKLAETGKKAQKKSNSDILKDDYNLDIKKGETKGGTPVWEVTGNTKEHKEAIKAAGKPRWYGPKKAWSFYDGDPTDNILKELGVTNEQPAIDDSQPTRDADLAEPSPVYTGQQPAVSEEVVPQPKANKLPRPRDGGDADIHRATGEGEGQGRRGTAQDDGADRTTGKQVEPDRVSRTDALSDKGKDTGLVSKPETAKGQNHSIAPDDVIVPSGKVARINANIKAIKLVKKLDKAGRPATPAEQKILAQFVGWGAFAQDVFRPQYARYARDKASYPNINNYYGFYNDSKLRDGYADWEKKFGNKLHPELGGALTQEEWDTAAASTLNAHYTDRKIIENTWQLAERLGFTGGKVLEPSAGVGHFIGLAPHQVRSNTAFTAVELDQLSGKILGYLYPQSNVRVKGFQDAGIRDNSQDMVISNFPFGAYKVYDKKRPEYGKWSIHNYFFGKSIDAVKPGGLVIGITSHFTLDAVDAGGVRGVLKDKADFVGAIRLPGTAFKENAGTEVVTDIIVLRKKGNDSFSGNQPFRLVEDVKVGNKKAVVNEYFVKHPEMVLGAHSLKGSMYGTDEYTVLPDKSTPIEEQLTAAINSLPRDIIGENDATIYEEGVYAKEGQREGSLVIDKGSPYLVENSSLIKPEWGDTKARAQRAVKYVELRNHTTELIGMMQKDATTDAEIVEARKKLNTLYDKYIKKYNPINHSSNSFLQDDIEFPSVMGLENVKYDINDAGEKIQKFLKADIFTKRTIHPFRPPTSSDSVPDAFNVSLIYKNGVDVPYIAELAGVGVESARAEIVDLGLAYENPHTGLLETADDYLSGNVREKLKQAIAAGAEENASALEKVQPTDLTIDQIHFKLGSSWIPPESVKDFIKDKLKMDAKVKFARVTYGEDGMASWKVTHTGWGSTVENREVYGTSRVDGLTLIEKALNLKRPEVFDPGETKGSKVKNNDKTIEAQERQKSVQSAFSEYIKGHPKWSKHYATEYNQRFNGIVPRRTAVPDIVHYPGANTEITLRPHQKSAVSRGLKEGTLFAHQVGAGKTHVLNTLAMEMRRLKTARKPMIVVQGSTLLQYAAEFKQLYPAANILAPTERQRSAKYRKRLLAQVATGDYDAVILPHSFFDRLENSPVIEAAFIKEQMAEIMNAIEFAREEEGKKSFTAKELEKVKQRKETRLKQLADLKGDTALYFEDLGVDALLIDEAHEYKRGEFFTKMGNIKGIDQGSAKKSFRLLMKSRHVQEKTGGKNIHLATGTPISNTTAEFWTLFRYARPDLLKEFDIQQFDDFASSFGNTTLAQEMTLKGDFKTVERFNEYINGPEFLTIWRSGADVVLTEDIDLPNMPKMKTGKPIQYVVPRAPEIGRYMTDIKKRYLAWEGLSGKAKMENRHVPLVLFGEARKAAIDLRLISSGMPDVKDSKANAAVDEVFARWESGKADRTTQLVFSDLMNSPDKKFNLFEDIKAKLVAKGVPANEIVITTNMNDAQKLRMVQDIRAGVKRIAMGSTKKLGTGNDFPQRMIAAHHLDVLQVPMHFEQRNGRIVRQGNMHKEVEVIQYGTENTLDALGFDRLVAKQRFINQVMRGDITDRTFSDPSDDTQVSFAEMAAAFSGNPLLKEKSELDVTIRTLQSLEFSHQEGRSRVRMKVAHLDGEIPKTEVSLTKARQRTENFKVLFPEGKPTSFTYDGKEYDRKDFTKAISKGFEAMEKKIQDKLGGKTSAEIMVADKDGLTLRKQVIVDPENVFTVRLRPDDVRTASDDIIDEVRLDYAVYAHKKGEQFQSGHARRFNKIGGLTTVMDNYVAEMVSGKNVDAITRALKKQREDLEKLKDQIDKPFEKALELKEAQKRFNDITEELSKMEDEDLAADKDEKKAAPESSTTETITDGATVPELRREFKKHGFKDSPAFNLLQNEQELPEHLRRTDRHVRAVYDPATDKTYFVAENIPLRKARGVFLHEVGAHYGLKRMLSDKRYDMVMGEVDALIKANNPAILEALEKVPRDVAPENRNEDVLGYLVENENNHKMNVVQRIVSAIKSFIAKNFGIGRLNVHDLVSLVKASTRRATRGETMVMGDEVTRRTQSSPSGLYSLIMDEPTSEPAWTNDKFKSKHRSMAERAIESVMDYKKNWRARTFDRVRSILEMDKALGIEDKSQQAYTLYRMLGNVQNIVSTYLVNGNIKWDASKAPIITTKDQGFLRWFEELGEDGEKFLKWLAATRAEVLDAEGRENWLGPKDRQEIFDWTGTRAQNGKTWAELNFEFQKFNKNILDFAEEAGLIDPDARKGWESDVYIPFYRVLEQEEGGGADAFLRAPRKGKQFISAGIKRLKGGEAPIGDLLENVITNWTHLIDQSMQNVARKQAYEEAMALGVAEDVKSSELVKLIGARVEKRYAVMKDGSERPIRIFEENEQADAYAWAEDLMMRKGESYFVVPRNTEKVAFGRKEDFGILSFSDNGQNVNFRVNDSELFNAIAGVRPDFVDNFFMKAATGAKRVLTHGVTLAPAFRIANALRDSISTSVVSRSFMPFVDTWKGMVKTLARHPDYIAVMSSGAGFGQGYVTGNDPEAMARYIKKIVKKEGKSARHRILDTGTKLWDMWEKLGEASEMASRVQLYANLRKKGVSHLEAAFESKDIMDFSMSGNSRTVQMFIQMIPFLNARAQGTYKLGRAAAEDKVGFFLKGAGWMATALGIWLMNKDDERYKELEDWEKWAYTHFWIGEKHYRIPNPFEVGTIFITTPTAVFDTMYGNEETKYIVDFAAHAIRDTFAVNPMPQLFRPALEVYQNRSNFTGRPIVSRSLEKLPAGEQAYPWTNESLKALGRVTNMSPKKMEHLIRGYFSNFGVMAMAASDLLYTSIVDTPTRPEWTVADVPGVGRFARPADPSRRTKYENRIYDLIRDQEQLVALIRRQRVLGDYKAADALMAKHKGDVKYYKYLLGQKWQMQAIDRRIKLTWEDKKLSSIQKREQVDDLVRTKNKISTKTYKTVKGR